MVQAFVLIRNSGHCAGPPGPGFVIFDPPGTMRKSAGSRTTRLGRLGFGLKAALFGGFSPTFVPQCAASSRAGRVSLLRARSTKAPVALRPHRPVRTVPRYAQETGPQKQAPSTGRYVMETQPHSDPQISPRHLTRPPQPPLGPGSPRPADSHNHTPTHRSRLDTGPASPASTRSWASTAGCLTHTMLMEGGWEIENRPLSPLLFGTTKPRADWSPPNRHKTTRLTCQGPVLPLRCDLLPEPSPVSLAWSETPLAPVALRPHRPVRTDPRYAPETGPQ